MSLIVYLSGKYEADTKEEKDENIKDIMTVAGRLWILGFTVICPHLNSFNFQEVIGPMIDYAEWTFRYISILERCDAIILMPGYESRETCKIEKRCAEHCQIPVFIYPDIPLPLKYAGTA
jgi:hypothetical protein